MNIRLAVLTFIKRAVPAHFSTEILLLWINRGLETLWLTAAVLVPLVYLGREYGEWSSIIGSYELPKIALLRAVAGFMVVFWVLEWVLTSPSPFENWSNISESLLKPQAWLKKLYGWLTFKPVRWLWLVVGLYTFSVFISTALSGALRVSLWGDIPGQDSYSAYTIASYIVLFAVVATHLKTPTQLWRLLGAITFMGTLVGGYAIFQHYGHDFLNILEPRDYSRATSATGGPIFAASLLLMTVTVSLLGATMAIKGSIRASETWAKTTIFTLVIAVQALGIIFTLSRGPWVGTALALAALLILAAGFVGWRYAAKATLVLAVAAIMTTIILVSPIPKQVVDEDSPDSPVAAQNWAAESVPVVRQRLTSIASPLGGISGRINIWRNSWKLMLGRPWAGFDSLSLDYLRPVIGYGPDLYRYTYLLESQEDARGRAPSETAHGHNILIHEGVELGFLGLLAILGTLLAPLLLAAYWLLFHRQSLETPHKLLLAGLSAVLAGRILEQMVGVARVSDLALTWTLLAIFVAVSTMSWGRSSVDEESEVAPGSGQTIIAHSGKPVSRPLASKAKFSGLRLISSFLLVALVVAGVGGLIWSKNVNYVRAAFAADQGAEKFRSGDLAGALDSLDRAIELAPDVSTYYRERSYVSLTFLRDAGSSSSTQAAGQAGGSNPALVRLAEETYASNARWVAARPLDVHSRASLAESALTLENLKPDSGWAQEAARLFEDTILLVPGNMTLRNRVAELYISLGQPEAAFSHLAIAKTSKELDGNRIQAWVNEGVAYRDMGDLENSLGALNQAITLRSDQKDSYQERATTYYLLNDLRAAIADLDESIRLQHPAHKQAGTFYLRGRVYFDLSRYGNAISDLDRAITLSPNLAAAYNQRGLVYARQGGLERSLVDFDAAIRLDSGLAAAYNNRGFVLRDLGRLERALEDLDRAVNLDPGFQLAYYNRALANTLLGLEAEGEADARRAIELGLDPDLMSRAISELKSPE